MLEIIIVCVAGFMGGFIGSQVGAGAIITLPALLLIGMPLPLAVGTNTLSGWLINVVAAFKYWRAGKVHFGFIIPLSIIGSYIGAKVVMKKSGTYFKALLIFVVLLVIAKLVFMG